MLYLIKNNFKLFKKYKIQFIIISLIMGVAMSLAVSFFSSTSYQNQYIRENAQKTNLDDFIVDINNKAFYSQNENGIYNCDLKNDVNNDILGDFINDFNKYYLKTNDPSMLNVSLSYQKHISSSIFFADSYNNVNTGNINFSDNNFTITNDGYVDSSNKMTYKNDIVCKPNTLNVPLKQYDGTYYYVYVSMQWAKKNHFSIGSSFALFDKKFKIQGYINSAFYSAPIALNSGSFNKAYKNPFIVLNPADYNDIFSDFYEYFNYKSECYYVAKFNKKMSDKTINKYIQDIKKFRFMLNTKYKNYDLSNNTLNYFKPSKNATTPNKIDSLFYIYNSKYNKITMRYETFIIFLSAQNIINTMLVLVIIFISFVIFGIIIKQRLDKDRYQVGLLKCSGYTNFKIGISWIGSSVLISITSFILTMIGSQFLIILINKFLSQSYLLTFLPIKINYLMFLIFILLFLFTVIFSVGFSMFTTREKPLELLSNKKRFSLGYFSSKIVLFAKPFNFIIRFTISSFLAGGFRSLFSVLIIFASTILVLTAIFINQIIGNTYDTLTNKYKANYVYKSTLAYDSQKNQVNEMGNYKFINLKSNDFLKSTTDFYNNNQNGKLDISIKKDINGTFSSFVDNNNNFLQFVNYLISTNYMDSSYQDIMKNYNLFFDYDSFIINNNSGENSSIFSQSNSLILQFSKWLSDYILVHYNKKLSTKIIVEIILKLRTYFALSGKSNSYVGLNFCLYNSKSDFLCSKESIMFLPDYDNYIGGDFQAYVGNNNQTLYKASPDIDTTFTNNNAKFMKNNEYNVYFINSNNNNYHNFFPEMNFDYLKNDNIDEKINNFQLPITISKKVANSYNLKVGSKFNNGLYDLLTETTYSASSESLKINYGQNFVNSFLTTAKYYKKTPSFYVSKISNDNTSSLFLDSNILNKYINNMYSYISSMTKSSFLNTDYKPGGKFWNNFSNSYNFLLSQSNINYTFNNKNSMINFFPQAVNNFDINDDDLYKKHKESADNNRDNGFLSWGSYALDENYRNSLIKDHLDIFSDLFFMIFIISIIIALVVIFLLNVILVEENFSSISILKLFGYRTIKIAFMYLSINLPIIIMCYISSIFIVNKIILIFLNQLSKKTGIDLINYPSILYILYGFIAFILVYLICLYVVRKIIFKINISKLDVNS